MDRRNAINEFVVVGLAFTLKPDQSKPRQLFSMGDSMTRGFNANTPLDNLNLRGVNGYHGFCKELFGLPDVDSPNQRIDPYSGTAIAGTRRQPKTVRRSAI